MRVTEPTCFIEFIPLAVDGGWNRGSLAAAPVWVLTDWCRDRGWERMAEYFETTRAMSWRALTGDPERMDQWIASALKRRDALEGR